MILSRKPLAIIRDAVRAQLWPIPVLAVVLAVAGGLLLPGLDLRVDGSVPGWLSSLLFSADAGAARTVLDAVSSSLITVTSLTFSLTVVTLQLASSQFSPRLLRTFASDAFVQATLGLFLATFTYSLTVLRTVRSSNRETPAFVPRISVTLSFLLAIASVIGLVVFLAHLVRQIRVETMLRDVHRDATSTVRAVLQPRDDGSRPATQLPDVPDSALLIVAPASGFILRFDHSKLLAAARSADVTVVIDAYPGSSLVEGIPIGRTWHTSSLMSEDAAATLQERIGEAIYIGYERTAAQDVGHGLRQLTDVANKALSPGINDPTTAVHALGHISALLCELADRDLGPVMLCDDEDHVRVVLHRQDLAMLVDSAITQPRRYGANDPQVMARLMALLQELAWRVPAGHQDVVHDQLQRLRATVRAQNFDSTETAQLQQAARQVERALASGRRASD